MVNPISSSLQWKEPLLNGQASNSSSIHQSSKERAGRFTTHQNISCQLQNQVLRYGVLAHCFNITQPPIHRRLPVFGCTPHQVVHWSHDFPACFEGVVTSERRRHPVVD